MATAAWRPPFPCIDVHVHLHPPRLAAAIERHFAHDGWVAAHSFDPDKVAATLAERGVERFCFFSYAHKPGMARELNRWVAQTAARLPTAVGFGTLHPDDADVDDVAHEATERLGLRGFKFHHSVQRFHVDDARLFGVYARAEAAGHVLVLHAGTMPYRDAFTGVAHVRRVLDRFPRLTVVVAHMGAFESDAFLRCSTATRGSTSTPRWRWRRPRSATWARIRPRSPTKRSCAIRTAFCSAPTFR